jgi:phosphoenolpyruvate phosphomutase
VKALILASGVGSRLPEWTAKTSKVLVPVNGIPLLDRMLTQLHQAGIHDVIITTGSFAEQVESFVASHPLGSSMNVRFVFNPEFASTNYIVSMDYARAFLLDDDILSFHGDLIFDDVLLQRILTMQTSSVLISKKTVTDSKDFIADVVDDRVRKIGVRIEGENLHACMPLYHIKCDDMRIWMEKIAQFVQRGERMCYAENALNDVLLEIALKPVFYGQEFVMEVDTPEDLLLASRYA